MYNIWGWLRSYTWAQNFDSWWDCLHKSATIAKKEGLLGAQEIDTLKNVLPQMAVHHKRCQLGQTLWVHLWVDHMTCLGMLSSGMPLAPLLPSRQKKGTRL